MNLEQSFTYPFKNKKWYINILIGSLICLPLAFANYIITIADKKLIVFYAFLFCIYIICQLVTSIFIDGYLCVNANYRIITGDKNPIKWNEHIDNIIFSGFKALCGTLIYKIPICIFGMLAFLAYVPKLYENLIKPQFHFPPDIFLTICTLLFFVDIILLPAFITNLKFKSFFNFKLIKNIIKNNTIGFILIVIMFLVIALIYKSIQTILAIPNFLFILINAFLLFYITLIKSDLFTQFIKEKL